jgi:hypothetical protein
MAWVAVAGLAVGVGATAYGIATAPKQPNAPDAGSSSAIASASAAMLLPIQRGMEAAYQTGGKFTYTVPDGLTGTLLGEPGTTHTVDFGGRGEGDIQAAIAKKTAVNNLVLSKKYDSKFIAEALKQEALADPESVEARAKMHELIRGQIDRPLETPVSDMMQAQVGDSLRAASQGRLTDMDAAQLNRAVQAAQADRGGPGDTPEDFEQPLTTGFAGEQRQQKAVQDAMAFLASGSSPEDIAYRRTQQNLANLAAEAGRKTPQSQFSSLSGAQTGPTPMQTKAPLSVMPEGQSAAAQGAALSNWRTQMSLEQNQVNPWLSGLSGLMQLAGTASTILK